MAQEASFISSSPELKATEKWAAHFFFFLHKRHRAKWDKRKEKIKRRRRKDFFLLSLWSSARQKPFFFLFYVERLMHAWRGAATWLGEFIWTAAPKRNAERDIVKKGNKVKGCSFSRKFPFFLLLPQIRIRFLFFCSWVTSVCANIAVRYHRPLLSR